jgi:hypothetical protein
MSEPLTYEAFANNLNTKFRISVDENNALDAELTQVSERFLSPQQERFSIIFRAPYEPFLGQGIRHFEHDQLPPFELFIVPIQRDEQGTLYEAVFNHLIKQPSPQA